MTKKDFDLSLKSLNLSRQDFCKITGLAYSSVANWHDVNKPIPSWVASWINNYTKAKKYEIIESLIKDKMHDL